MSIFRSYFSKNNVLLKNSYSNFAKNPVAEIGYGTTDNIISRYIFDFDFTGLSQRMLEGNINPYNISGHTLHLTNTIHYFKEAQRITSYSDNINRASSFKLDLFNVNQDWDEGVGYTFSYLPIYDSTVINTNHSNWFNAKTNTGWTNPGLYVSGNTSGSTVVINSQSFDEGIENLNIDITDYINFVLFTDTIYTGFTNNYTIIPEGGTFGLGLKYQDQFENLKTTNIQSVAFFGKDTNSYFEPYIETIINDNILDDRNYFYQDRLNNLYFYYNEGGFPSDNIIISGVTIYDYKNKIYQIIPVSGITKVKIGVYNIKVQIDSSLYPNSVIFEDSWTVIINNKVKQIKQSFYLFSSYDNLLLNKNIINPDNYFLNFQGIKENESIRETEIRKIQIYPRELYSTKNNKPLNIYYRVFTMAGTVNEIDVIPISSVNITNKGYEIDLDMYWLIPQDYFLEFYLFTGYDYVKKNKIRFSVVNSYVLNNETTLFDDKYLKNDTYL